jgi:hypothetical protein
MKSLLKTVFISILIMTTLACGASGLGGDDTQPVSHHDFDALLKKHVSIDGKVFYPGFKKDRVQLEKYLDLLSNNPPDRRVWSREEQLAYWINAYNAFTIKLIIDHYPIKSIQDLHPKVHVPLVNTVWHLKFFKIGGKDASLDEIEHTILRKEFDEPRIHFAINCASFSCPPLLNEAFKAEKLEEQLEFVTTSFINDPKRNQISEDHIQISQIFSWFKGDFTKNTTLIGYLNKYSNQAIQARAKITYLKYDWSLNE